MTPSVCSVKGCIALADSTGLCSAHKYLREHLVATANTQHQHQLFLAEQRRVHHAILIEKLAKALALQSHRAVQRAGRALSRAILNDAAEWGSHGSGTLFRPSTCRIKPLQRRTEYWLALLLPHITVPEDVARWGLVISGPSRPGRSRRTRRRRFGFRARQGSRSITSRVRPTDSTTNSH